MHDDTSATDCTAEESCPSAEEIAERVDALVNVERPRYRRLWAYCRNPMRAAAPDGDGAARPYRQAQEWGLPARITGFRSSTADVFGGEILDEIARKEIVIENDIGWRVETMVDFLFGKPPMVESAAPDPARRAVIGELLRQVLAHNGGVGLLQQMSLIGSVHGFVDVLVKLDMTSPQHAACGTRDLGAPPAETAQRNQTIEQAPPQAGPASEAVLDDSPTAAASDDNSSTASLARLAGMVRLELIEPARALPFLSATDFRNLRAYGQCYELPRRDRSESRTAKRGIFQRLRRLAAPRKVRFGGDEQDVVVELITPTHWSRYENDRLVAEGENSLGRIPLVHVQNTAVHMEYAGGSDVEPLIPLQDELNTRLSDRANRITMQSFKMYLGKGIENFTSLPIAPGRMWMTDNEAADVVEFGGDSASPSEESHITDIREALDKTSGVTPIAAGAVEGRIGNLTSAAALRITLQALLSKTEKKRSTYGLAIEQMCELALAWLDRAGLFATTAEERGVELNWPSPLPVNELERLQEAEAKARLGVGKDILLRELGY
jgi:hypothetical protein